MSAKKLLYNGWKDKPNRKCAYCGQYGAERHEIFPGMNRQISIRERLQVDLCREHHEQIQQRSTPWGQREDQRLRENAERWWLSCRIKEGMTKREAVRAWMAMIGRNYLEEVTPE